MDESIINRVRIARSMGADLESIISAMADIPADFVRLAWFAATIIDG